MLSTRVSMFSTRVSIFSTRVSMFFTRISVLPTFCFSTPVSLLTPSNPRLTIPAKSSIVTFFFIYIFYGIRFVCQRERVRGAEGSFDPSAGRPVIRQDKNDLPNPPILSGIRESDPSLQLGKLTLNRSTNPASGCRDSNSN